jgi:hypothetical protein
VSFWLIFMKIAPLESLHFPLKKLHSISSNYILPPFLWYLSNFSIVFHENRTIGKFTFSSQKVAFNLLQLHPPNISVVSQWVFNCFSWKLHHWKANIFLFKHIKRYYQLGCLHWGEWRGRLDHLFPPSVEICQLFTSLIPSEVPVRPPYPTSAFMALKNNTIKWVPPAQK